MREGISLRCKKTTGQGELLAIFQTLQEKEPGEEKRYNCRVRLSYTNAQADVPVAQVESTFNQHNFLPSISFSFLPHSICLQDD